MLKSKYSLHIVMLCALFVCGCNKKEVSTIQAPLPPVQQSAVSISNANSNQPADGPNIVKLFKYPSGEYRGYKDTSTGKIFDKDGLEVKSEQISLPAQNSLPAKQKTSFSVVLTSSPEKRLLEVDLLNSLKKEHFDNITFIDKSTLNKKTVSAIILRIKELAYVEKEGTPTRNSVILPSNKIDFAVAVFAMPKNASVIMDVVKQTNSIDYAYEIELEKNGSIIKSNIIRDRIESTGESCENFRVRNVFGGEKAMEHYPSKEIRSLCQGASVLKSIQSLRDKVNFEISRSATSTLNTLN